jgi:type I restriction enzyme S subunit
VNEAEHDPFFVYHLLTTLKDELKANAGGAATPIINKTAFSEIQVCVPPLPVQRRIAGILSAYDELIENSQRRVRLLEEMARAFYCEWFVHFRFPGHESVPRLPSALGDIPQGWEVKPLSALCSRMESGGTPKRKSPAYWADGSIDWFKTGELWDGFLFGSEEKITELGQRESNARIFEPGTILMAIYGSPTVGRLGIVTRPSSCNQAALGLVADKKQISQTFLYFVLLTLRAHFNGLAQGAAQQNISKEKVANAVALVPPPALVAAFDRLAEPTFNQIQILQRQVQNLRRTRDLLLPRLLSGQLNPICRLA